LSDDSNWLSAREMARRFAKGELSPVDVLEELQAAYAEMRALGQKMQLFHQDHDLLLTPTVPHHRPPCRRRHARYHALPPMVRLDAIDVAVQPHPPTRGLGALRFCRRSADRVADRGADVRRGEDSPSQPLRRAGLRHRRAAASQVDRTAPA